MLLIDTDCSTLQVGQRFSLLDGPEGSRDYRIVAIEHVGDQSAGKIYSGGIAWAPAPDSKDFFSSPSYKASSALALFHSPLWKESSSHHMPFAKAPQFSDQECAQENFLPHIVELQQKLANFSYRNRLLCIPADVPYRTPVPLFAQKPYQGTLTAKIESVDDGAYAFLNAAGYYAIRFPFDHDNPQGRASPALRLAQSYSGPGYGIHFPLRAGTEVMVGFENGNIDRPLLLGVLPTTETPSPVTTENVTQNLLRTASSHALLMEDTPGQESTQLATHDQQLQLLLDGKRETTRVRIATEQGDMLLQAKHTFTTETQGNFAQTIGKEHHITIENNYHANTEQGDIQLQSGRDLKLSAAKDLQLHTEQQDLSLRNCRQYDLASWTRRDPAEPGGNIQLTTQSGSFFLEAGKSISIGAQGRGDII